MQFSIVMPVNNSELYLSEAIESIINQSLDFKENIEIILVENSSKDRSKEICQEYNRRFPKNIKVVHLDKPNVSEARNLGIELSSESSKYIGFIDSDDKVSSNTIESILDFFNKNKNINLTVMPLYFFDSKSGPHPLNYRFTNTSQIVNIQKDYSHIQYHIGGVFFRKQALKNRKHFFNINLDFWEDALFINEFLLKDTKYGLISNASYYYRKREKQNSLVDLSWQKKGRYNDFLEHCYFTLIRRSLQYYGEVIPYIQFLVIYHLKLFLFQKYNHMIYEVLTDKEQVEFFMKLCEVLKHIDERIIIEQKMNTYFKDYIISLKRYGYPVKKLISTGNISNDNVVITNWRISGRTIRIFGSFLNREFQIDQDDKLFIVYGNKKQEINNILEDKKLKIWGTTVRYYKYFKFSVDIPLFTPKFSFQIKNSEGFIHLNDFNILKKIINFLSKNQRRKKQLTLNSSLSTDNKNNVNF
ncbi:glycosyltransferase [Bacillus haynesii]|uniref:glycosyltransferase family 2 protein n=1 Tax=Bacillus haynesii TaxID=1925021 RepID=UPI0022822C84|nr:glycosyltransferase family 2 protein [Bacillus haynesii]MCY8666391.1 glycosyltransferase [Bacillus haynesii]